MPLTEVFQQSLAGNIWGLLTLPFRLAWKIVAALSSLITRTLFMPFKVIGWLYRHILNLAPEFYAENLSHSFGGLSALTRVIFLLFTGLLFILTPVFIIIALVTGYIKGGETFDILHVLTLATASVLTTEAAIFGLCLVGFLGGIALAFLAITGASLLEFHIELIKELLFYGLFLFLAIMLAVMLSLFLYFLLSEVPSALAAFL